MSILNLPHQQNHTNPISRYFYRLIEQKLPRRVKRLIYISSILGLIQQVKEPDMRLVDKINRVFKVANSPEAYRFPVYIKGVIWRGMCADITVGDKKVTICSLKDTVLDQEEQLRVGNYFALQAPDWLKYGSMDLMVQDVLVLIGQLKKHQSA